MWSVHILYFHEDFPLSIFLLSRVFSRCDARLRFAQMECGLDPVLIQFWFWFDLFFHFLFVLCLIHLVFGLILCSLSVRDSFLFFG